MRFFTRPECEDYCGKLGILARDVVDEGRPPHFKNTLWIFSPNNRLPPGSAESIVSALGKFTNALLWTHSLIWGDQTRMVGAERSWTLYGWWRDKCGAPGGLYDYPGQLFDPPEAADLAKGIEWTMLTGSDALVIARPTRAIVHLSHDEFIRAHSRTNLTALKHQLQKLGWTPARQ